MTPSIPNFKFKNKQLLTTALTHRSALNEKKGKISNERLEYLGDAVLEFLVSDYIYKKYPFKPEGDLTHIRAKIVQTKTLSIAAQKLKLGPMLIMSKGEKLVKGHQNTSILANTFEAVLGAIYLDQGLIAARRFVLKHLLSHLDLILKSSQVIDYKSLLQEKTQKKHKLAPVYQVTKTHGPDHNKKFTVKVTLKQKTLALGQGNSKQDAQQQAAQKALEKFKHI